MRMKQISHQEALAWRKNNAYRIAANAPSCPSCISCAYCYAYPSRGGVVALICKFQGNNRVERGSICDRYKNTGVIG